MAQPTKKKKKEGHGASGGKVVSVPSFNSDDPSSNTVVVFH